VMLSEWRCCISPVSAVFSNDTIQWWQRRSRVSDCRTETNWNEADTPDWVHSGRTVSICCS